MKPRVSLVKGSDGALYGATAEGGSFWGTVFKISPRSGFGDSVASARADDVAFRHVTVVDVVEGRLLRGRGGTHRRQPHRRGKSVEKIAGANVPFEPTLFIGYDKANKRYILHSISVWGAGRPGEFAYGRRIGTEIKFDVEATAKRGFGRFIWQPDSKTGSYVTGVEKGTAELGRPEVHIRE